MHHFKRVATLILAAGLCLSLLTGCAGKPAVDGIENKLSVCVGAAPVTLDPIYAEEIADQTVLAHLYENLMRVSVDENGVASVVGGMAKDVEVVENHDGTVTYTFKLRNAKWSDGGCTGGRFCLRLAAVGQSGQSVALCGAFERGSGI